MICRAIYGCDKLLLYFIYVSKSPLRIVECLTVNLDKRYIINHVVWSGLQFMTLTPFHYSSSSSNMFYSSGTNYCYLSGHYLQLSVVKSSFDNWRFILSNTVWRCSPSSCQYHQHQWGTGGIQQHLSISLLIVHETDEISPHFHNILDSFLDPFVTKVFLCKI